MDKVKFREIKQKALDAHIPIIMDDTLEIIEKRFENNKLDSILEIGTACGYSAICFSKLLSDVGIIDTIERDEERYNDAVKNIQNMGLTNKVRLFLGDAVEILPSLDKTYDMIFIDAAKREISTFLK